MRPSRFSEEQIIAILREQGAGAATADARGGRALVAEQPQGEAGEDRRQDRHACPGRHVPDGRGGGAKGPVQRDPAAHRGIEAAAYCGASFLPLTTMRAERNDRRGAPC
jgi:hypothetical protein